MKKMLKSLAFGFTFVVGATLLSGPVVTEASAATPVAPAISNSQPQLTHCGYTYGRYGRDGHWHTYHHG